jgi:hypothetical protein
METTSEIVNRLQWDADQEAQISFFSLAKIVELTFADDVSQQLGTAVSLMAPVCRPG